MGRESLSSFDGLAEGKTATRLPIRIPLRRPGFVRLVCGVAIASASVASIVTASLLSPSLRSVGTQQHAEDIPGWLVERLFHADGSTACPWTQQPASDADCLWRRSKLEELRANISTCTNPLRRNEVVFAHRGAALVAPEETEASWEIGVRSGAAFIECDASPTADGEFVCRHSTCDLAQTTDIVANQPEMLERCSKPWRAASEAVCCTYDFTLAELSRLCAIMDSLANESATERGAYLIGPPSFRSPYISQQRCHPIVSLRRFLELARTWGVGVVPELKDTWKPELSAFLAAQGRGVESLAESFLRDVRGGGFTGEFISSAAAQRAGGARGAAAVTATKQALLQTFDPRVARVWKQLEPSQAVLYLFQTDRLAPPISAREAAACSTPNKDCADRGTLEDLVRRGVDVLAPAMHILLASEGHRMVASAALRRLQSLINQTGSHATIGTWSVERSGCDPQETMARQGQGGAPSTIPPPGPSLGTLPSIAGPCGFYWQGLQGVSAFQHADTLLALDTLLGAGVESIFSDFPAAVSAVVNCRERDTRTHTTQLRVT
jgi:glycerophosphoryl diester phosphodiesterase